jgi:hypothetical protein
VTVVVAVVAAAAAAVAAAAAAVVVVTPAFALRTEGSIYVHEGALVRQQPHRSTGVDAFSNDVHVAHVGQLDVRARGRQRRETHRRRVRERVRVRARRRGRREILQETELLAARAGDAAPTALRVELVEVRDAPQPDVV